MGPVPNIGDSATTQPRATDSHVSDSSTTTFDEHMALYGFLTREKAMQLWHAVTALRKDASSAPESPDLTSRTCQCRVEDALADTVRHFPLITEGC